MSRLSLATVEKEFNSDLLLSDDDLDLAKKKYPGIAHVLDFPELREAFQMADAPANQAKSRSYRNGFCAVLCGVGCLSLAAATPVLHDVSKQLTIVLSVMSAILGVTSVILLNFGLLIGGRKETWLRKRLITERIRQFYFQSFVCRLDRIVQSMDGTPEAIEQFLSWRSTEFRSFLKNHSEAGWLISSLTKYTDENLAFDPWLMEQNQDPSSIDENRSSEVFRAYRELRFKGQLDYANWMLRKGEAGVSRRQLSISQKRTILYNCWLYFVVSLVLVHLVTLVGSVAGWDFVQNSFLHVGIIWIALITIGVRTLEHGMSLSTEIARYEEYRAEITIHLQDFDGAATVERRLECMRDMELESVRELRNFLRQQRASSFVI